MPWRSLLHEPTHLPRSMVDEPVLYPRPKPAGAGPPLTLVAAAG